MGIKPEVLNMTQALTELKPAPRPIQVQVAHEDGKVFIVMSRETNSLAMSSNRAIDLANALKRHARRAWKTQGSTSSLIPREEEKMPEPQRDRFGRKLLPNGELDQDDMSTWIEKANAAAAQETMEPVGPNQVAVRVQLELDKPVVTVDIVVGKDDDAEEALAELVQRAKEGKPEIVGASVVYQQVRIFGKPYILGKDEPVAEGGD